MVFVFVVVDETLAALLFFLLERPKLAQFVNEDEEVAFFAIDDDEVADDVENTLLFVVFFTLFSNIDRTRYKMVRTESQSIKSDDKDGSNNLEYNLSNVVQISSSSED